ncbi:MAG TPA: hypothetical protein VG939_09115 [Caulobacteraceae bacterium]|nr:hypothetical protein [Caulobacteraceae bacterium]
MFNSLLQIAAVLDAWLHRNFGRPYMAMLGVGLVLGLGDNLSGLSRDLASKGATSKILVVAVFQVALLINQLAQFHEYRQLRLEHRAQRAAAKAARRGVVAGAPQTSETSEEA